MFKVNNKDNKGIIKVVLVSSLLTLNYFTPFSSFPIADFYQVNICRENYLTLYSFDICFNVSTGGRQDLTRNNAGNSVIFLISKHLASLQWLK